MDLSKYHERFVAESRLHLEEARSCLRRLREGDGVSETIDEAFRHAHSLKGMAATLGYEALASSADALEHLLEALRNDACPADPALSAIEQAVATIEERIDEPRGLPVGALEDELFEGVRRLAASQGKTIRVEVTGAERSLDPALVDLLCEPLLHLLLNAVDHGVEPPVERVRRGKPAAGSIVVRLDRPAGRVRLSVADDGRGIDEQAIRDKAIAEGWLGKAEAAALDSRGVQELLTRAGFSSACGDRAVSGRGIGLDAVRAAAVRLGGELTIESRLGRGTTVTLSLPCDERTGV